VGGPVGRAVAARPLSPRPRQASWALLVVVLLLVAYAVVYLAGGSQTAMPHVFYVPILIAAMKLGAVGGLGTAVVAAVLCGPLMPLDVAHGTSQEVANWLTRGVFFLLIAGLAVVVVGLVRRDYEADLTELLGRELNAEPDDRDVPDLQARVHDVLEQRSFHMVFQPIYSLRDGNMLAVEALARFDVEPYQPPNVWFEQAERAGLGVELQLATMRAALEASAELDPDVVLSLNTAPDVLNDPRLLVVLEEHPDRPVVVEVTEHCVIDDYHTLVHALDGLRARGVMLAVDDAGAGFASFRHIVRLAPDFIKLDLSLTQDVRGDPIRRALANSLIQFSRETGSLLIAEGIEEVADLTVWRELGAHAAQGYLLGRPAPLPAPQSPRILAGWRPGV
jgi:EAL domain-containing protein (putative c-di-GMP-specific phosphodiesterase class I)